ncbi:MAG: sensor histidine kinase [Candidatus Cloacimonetes bacterium]|nr:sensor histidine kinase [Candidatus Cloacimonadota bacterium]
MTSMFSPKLKRQMPWYTISIFLTILGTISIILLFFVYYFIRTDIIFWCIQVSWITVLLGSTIEICRQESLRKQADTELENELQQKRRLLKEVYYRITNNMQIISSMLKIQKDATGNKEAKKLFTESDNRVVSMALAHKNLYEADDLVHINFKDYVGSILRHLFGTYANDSNAIKLNTNIEVDFVNISIALPCGLIINELVSNSLKYAFPKGNKGEINIALQIEDNDNYVLTVSDNGVGFPENIDIRNTRTFGMQLVNILVDQLHSTVELDRENGTSVKISFKKVINETV